MNRRTWIYIIILAVVLIAGGVFFWWMYKTSKITPKAETTPTQTFSDVASDYWAYKEIEAVAKAGYMKGYQTSYFKPDDTATRTVLAVVGARVTNKYYDNPTPSFTDVPKDYVAYQEIEGMNQAGYMIGVGGGLFEPQKVADRATIAVVMARIKAGGDANVPIPAPGTQSFTDVPYNHPAYKYIEYVKAQGLMEGFADGSFKPADNATRVVLAIVTSRLTNKTYDNPTPTFVDVAKTYQWYKEIEGVNQAHYMIGVYVASPKFEPELTATRSVLATVLSRATNNSYNNPTPTFTDVPKEYWSYQEIEGVNKANIMIGVGGGLFKPDDLTTRMEIALAIFRAKGLQEVKPAQAHFVDVPTTDPNYGVVEALYQAGITNGCREDSSGLYYCPSDQATRAVLAVFLYRAFLGASTTASPSPQASPATSPSPVASPSSTPTPTATPTKQSDTGTGTSTTTGSAKTGPEIPLVSGGAIGLLFLVRYLVGRKLK